MYKLLIFDWDGTVIDSAARIVSSMQAAACDLNLGNLTDDQVRNIIGLGLPQAVKTLVPDASPDEVQAMSERYSYHYLEADDTPVQLFAGAHESLDKLHQMGIRLTIATGKSRAGLDRVLAQTGLGYVFETSRCADETLSKPDPLMVNEILEQTGVAAHEAVMIGDTEWDLAMGRKAGVDVIGVSYGAHHESRLHQYEPLLIAHEFSDIFNWAVENCEPYKR